MAILVMIISEVLNLCIVFSLEPLSNNKRQSVFWVRVESSNSILLGRFSK